MIVILKNIQSIKEFKYEFPTTGLVQIIGGNSNGKSILAKALNAVFTLSILDLKVRKSLMRRDCDEEKTISIILDKKILVVNLDIERDNCAFIYKRDSSDKGSPALIRTFREGGLREILNEMGIKCYWKDSFCLQIHETHGPMVFINTPTIVNGEMVEDATTDSTAQAFMKNYKEVTYPTGRKIISDLDNKIKALKTVKDNLHFYDYETYESLADGMEKYYNNLKHLEYLDIAPITILPKLEIPDIPIMHLEEIPILPKLEIPDIPILHLTEIPILNVVDIPDIPVMHLDEIPIMRFYECVGHLEDLTDYIHELNIVKQGKCPTCGKRLLD